MTKRLLLALLLLIFTAGIVQAEKTEFFKEFEKNYKALDVEVLSYIADMAEVENFVYKKDRATFTFKKGKFLLLRHVFGRPTAAIFIGEGNCRMELPTHNERQSLLWCSGDSLVNEDFQTCFIRMTDDLDLKLAEEYTLTEHKINWKEFNTYKTSQGEFFFRPVVMHEYDNYFQLLRSAYDREADGYFWIDFNRYVYKFDPSCAESSILAYEHEGGAFTITDAVALKRENQPISSDYDLSELSYPTTIIERTGEITLKGMSGKKIDEAVIDMKLLVNTDSLKFVSLFLHYNLKLDSIYQGTSKVDYWRRGGFTFAGVILPEYAQKGETLDLKFFYHGKDYSTLLPFVKNPAPSKINLNLITTTDFDLFVPGKSEPIKLSGRKQQYTVAPFEKYRHFGFQSVTSGFDTLTIQSLSGIPLNFLKSDEYAKGKYACFTPDKKFEQSLVNAFNFASPRLGSLPTDEPIFIYPDSTLSFPGLIEMRQLRCYDELTGELDAQAGLQVARQWFGPLMKPASNRDAWLINAMPDYFSLFTAQNVLSAKELFIQLSLRQQMIESEMAKNRDMPIGSGDRASHIIKTAKGSWLIHMLRFMMYDTEKTNELPFMKFMNEFARLSTSQTFTNHDFVLLAEKYVGQPLESFFEQWLFSTGIPKCDIKWHSENEADGYYLVAKAEVTDVSDSFSMPVWFRVIGQGNVTNFEHPVISAGENEFKFGPFPTEPEELIFNEFLSMLCKSDVDRQEPESEK